MFFPTQFKHSRKALVKWFLAIVAVIVLFNVSEGSIIKYQPNTLLEFHSLKCFGTYDKKQYVLLNQICHDCYNLFRNPGVMSQCRSNCFRNSLFPLCAAYLSLDLDKEEIESKVNLVNGL
ncbi:UNVERIFIED_CONTAM: hypothetical protein RMT77_001787 [Armadillidium vulgare]